MDSLIELLRAESNAGGKDDSLSKWISSSGGLPKVEATIRSRGADVDWAVFMRAVSDKAESVLKGVEARASQEKMQMDLQTKQVVAKMAVREACARQLQAIFQAAASSSPPQQSSREIASPYAHGARFDQIPSQTMEQLLKVGHGVIPRFMAKEWEIICVRDAERALRANHMTKMSEEGPGRYLPLLPKRHESMFPALISIAELLATLPRELNLKLRSRYCEVQGEVWLWTKTFQLPPPLISSETKQRILAGYVFARVDKDEKKDQYTFMYGDSRVKVQRNAVVVVNLPAPFTPSFSFAEDNVWMVCVTFDGI